MRTLRGAGERYSDHAKARPDRLAGCVRIPLYRPLGTCIAEARPCNLCEGEVAVTLIRDFQTARSAVSTGDLATYCATPALRWRCADGTPDLKL